MLQDDVPLRVCNLTCTPVSMDFEFSTDDHCLLIAIIKSLTISTTKGIWTRGKFYASDASEIGHLGSESAVSQSLLLRNLYAFDRILIPPKQRSFRHLLLQRHRQLFLPRSNPTEAGTGEFDAKETLDSETRS